jgi:cell division protein FtsB
MPSARPATAAPRRSDQTRVTRPRPRRVSSKGALGRVRWDRVGRVGLLVMLIAVVGLYVQHALAYLSTRSRAEQQQAIVQRLAADNGVLERERTQLNDPATIQRDARALGMVQAGERPYVITGLRNSH